MFNPRITALEYAVIFLLEEEEKKYTRKEFGVQREITPEGLQKLARLEDLRAELQLHMQDKS